ncbi:sn-glycerol-3-phosphate transport system permease protein ugpA [Nitrincola nitratireducens]|uniref:sn-glycerol-3-phosphate transport system permease protein ugpA n=2 Tax=Nitrincola nitratireducens TaxID=1229521 RepID=W9VAA4_9GAMM|nr:sn-glycerol-3-phosphate transport system permease protein ugpA [Nitrincola nitratireducens]
MSESKTADLTSVAMTPRRNSRMGDTLAYWMPKLVLSPTLIIVLVFFYGFILWTGYLSFTNSRMLPSYDFVGWANYVRLFNNERWFVSLRNLAVYSVLFIAICLAIGLSLAILLDQKIRAEGALRTIYLYPMALSFIVTGTVWKWMLNPQVGIEQFVRSLGWETFRFDWLVDPNFSIYTIVVAAVWQSSGFVMALFLAGLRGVDDSIIKAAQIDGASRFMIYTRIIIPSLRPVFFSAFVMLAHIAIKSFDLALALTGGGPGVSSDLPAIFMYQMSFTRNQMGLGAASAMIMLLTVVAILVPYLYSELRTKKHEH